MNIYDRIADLAKSKNISINQLAKDTNLSPAVFSQWKNAKSYPSARALQKIANYFNVPMEYLLNAEQIIINDFQEYHVNTKFVEKLCAVIGEVQEHGEFNLYNSVKDNLLKMNKKDLEQTLLFTEFLLSQYTKKDDE